MMAEISREYAEALYALALENKKETEFSDNLTLISEVLEQTPEYMDFLASLQIPLTERCNAIDEAFGSYVHEYILSFVKILCEKGYIRKFELCREEFNKMLDFSKKVSLAHIKSAVALTESEKDSLKAKLEQLSGHSVIMEFSEDESLIGGIVVEIDGKVLDGSVKHRLQEVKDVISR